LSGHPRGKGSSRNFQQARILGQIFPYVLNITNLSACNINEMKRLWDGTEIRGAINFSKKQTLKKWLTIIKAC
jgi:hypothetical protein